MKNRMITSINEWADKNIDSECRDIDWDKHRQEVARKIYERFQAGLAPVSKEDLDNPHFDFDEALFEFCPTDKNDVYLGVGMTVNIEYRGIPITGTIQSIDLERITITSQDQQQTVSFLWSFSPSITFLEKKSFELN